eukprot:COSAG03_NODE_5271_length_1291_cov_10.411074_3_plen_50_part_01
MCQRLCSGAVLVHKASRPHNPTKTPNDGYLGSRNDEERSEMRYAVRIAEF